MFLVRNANEIPWMTNESYPNSLRSVYRYKELVREKTIAMGVLELDPGAEYPAHAHPAREYYYIVDGEAEWVVDEQKKVLSAGAVIKHESEAVHAFKNLSEERTLKLVWLWWSDGSDVESLLEMARLIKV